MAANNFHLEGSLSFMEEYFRQFDLQHPEWGEAEHTQHAVKFVHPDFLMNMMEKDFYARKEGGNNIAMFMCGTQGSGKSISTYYFVKLASKIWGKKFRWENLGFFDAETSKSLDEAQTCESIWQDEHDSKTIGALSMYLKDRLVDFVLRGRKKKINFFFCSPIEQDKGQFITLEAKNTRKDHKTGKPICVECLVKTPWYFDSNQRFTRGIIFVPVADLLDELVLYDKRKDESLEKLKKQYGSNFDFIGTKAKEIYEQLKQFMVEKNKKGEWVVKKGIAFKKICLLGKGEVKGIGSSGTADSRDLMMESIREYALDYCNELNKEEERVDCEKEIVKEIEEDVEIVTSEE